MGEKLSMSLDDIVQRSAGTIRVARRVYVGNLSWRTSWQDLKDHFAQAGNVVYADVMKEADDPSRSKGCGIVEFETPEEAAVAIQTLNDVELNGRQVFVREDREDRDLKGGGGFRGGDFNRPERAPRSAGNPTTKRSKTAVAVGRRVYVGNLSWETTWQDLKDHFRNAGQVVYADVMKEPNSDRSKGCGIVEFEAPEEALRAMAQLSNTMLGGRQILVREDREDRDLRTLSGMATPGRGTGGGGRGGGGPSRGGGNGSGGRQIVVQNLPWSMTWQELKDLFRSAGGVVRTDVMEDNQGRSRGYGTVLFDHPSEAEKAIRMFNETEIDGRIITVKADQYA